MKKLIKIGALSLALIAAVFMLNTNAQTAEWTVWLEIDAGTARCVYGTSVYIGITPFSYADQQLSSGFLSTSGANRFCEDVEGDASWNMSIQATSPLLNMDNATDTIAATNVWITNTTGSLATGHCGYVAAAHTESEIGTNPVALVAKTGLIGQTCTVEIPSLTLGTNIPGSTPVGYYSGDLTVTYSANLGNGNTD